MTSTETMTTDAVTATAEAPQKKAPAKRTTTKKATPAKAAAEALPKAVPAPEKPAAPAKLRWTIGTEHADGKEQTATAEDRTYEITNEGDKQWNATVTVDGGTTTVLVEAGSFGRAYNAVTKHNKSQA